MLLRAIIVFASVISFAQSGSIALAQSCEGFCGGSAPGGCFCDEACCSIADCCDNKFEECGGCGDPDPDPPLCPVPLHILVSPPDGTVDARQPFAIEGGLTRSIGYAKDGIVVDLGVDGVNKCCFTACSTSPGPAPTVKALKQIGAGMYRVHLSKAMVPNSSITVGYNGQPFATYVSHPGNVNGDQVSSASDVLSMIDIVNGILVPPFGMYSADIDRSGVITPSDILRLVDLLNGAGAFPAQLGVAKPIVGDCNLLNPNCSKTCQNSCGGQAPGDCFCDQVCWSYGDCCADVCEQCPQLACLIPRTCPTNQCGWVNKCYFSCTGSMPGECYCDKDCCAFGDCCSNKFQVCGGCGGPDPIFGCNGFCGYQSPEGCFCDEVCCSFADCCADKQQACGGCRP